MREILDYIGSIVIGGLLLLSMAGFNATMGETAANQTFSSIVQRNLNSTTEVIEYDLRRIGYRVSDSLAIVRADTSSIVFKGDVTGNGVVDSIRYFLGSTKSKASANPRTKSLYRVLNNGSAQLLDQGVTRFRLWYYDDAGNTTSLTSRIRMLKIAIAMENTAQDDRVHAGAYWERVFKPKNLR